jgi:tetratricopeptide (TPR) repeat protein
LTLKGYGSWWRVGRQAACAGWQCQLNRVDNDVGWETFWAAFSGQSYLLAVVMLLVMFTITMRLVLRMAKQAPAPRAVKPKPTEKHAGLETGVDDWLRQGNDAMRAFRWDDALYYFGKVLDTRPDNPALWFRMGRIHVQKKAWQKAASDFEKALSYKPDMVEAHFELSRLYQRQELMAEAIAALETCLAHRRDYEPALKALPPLLRSQKQFNKAQMVIEQLLAAHPNNPDFVLQGLACYEDQKAWEQAITFLQTHQAKFSEPMPDFEVKLARLHLANGKPETTITMLQAMRQQLDEGQLKIPNETPATLASTLVEAYTAKGAQAEERGELMDAIVAYQAALALEPGHTDLQLKVADAYMSLGQGAKALMALEDALVHDGRNANLHFKLGQVYDHQNEPKVALKHYQSCIELDPCHVEANYAMGTLCGLNGDLNGAIKFLLRVIQMAPEFVEGYYNLAVAYEQQGQKTKALGLYKKVLDFDPAHEAAKSNLRHLQSKW